MKKYLIQVIKTFVPVMVLVMCFVIDASGNESQIDTLVHRQVAPGITYTKTYFPMYPLNVYMLTVDLNNEYNTVETFQAGNQAGKTEAMTDAFKRLTTASHTPIGSVNGNFWIVSGQGYPNDLLGVPHSGSIRNGEMVTEPNDWNRGHGNIGFAALDKNKKLWIDDMNFDGKVIVEGQDSYSISQVNRVRGADELVFFNNYVGKTRTDDSGTEVFIKPVEGQIWGINEDVSCEVIRIIKGKGSNDILPGESVLSGSGIAQTFLDKLQVGQLLKVNMGVCTLVDNFKPMVQQMVTGNALVMKNGELTDRNTNESYNSQLYPRTGIGMSEDGKKLFLIVIDKQSGSIGATTATMCEILKSVGAYNVASMDGGGSAQMMLQGSIVNKPADGKERPVANGWMLFSTAPLDESISTIDFSDYTVVIPANASYKPDFLGYNKYGMLVTEHLEGVTLTCDSELGRIVDGNLFVASSVPQQGELIAHYNGKVLHKKVVIEKSDISFRLDSVILDNKMKYPIEIEAQSNKTIFPIEPSLLNWQVEDKNICKIENGVLEGLKNGVTWITGTYGDFIGRMKVIVEIPENTTYSFGNFAAPDWKITTNISNANQLMIGTEEDAKIEFTYQSARSPYILMAKDIRLYSLPKAIKFTIDPHNTTIKSTILGLKVNGELKSRSIELGGLEKNTDNEVVIPVSSLLDNVNDLAYYPLTFNSLKFMLEVKDMMANEKYTIELKEFQIQYENSVGLVSSNRSSEVIVYPNPIVDGKLYLSMILDKEEKLYADVYSISGRCIKKITPVVCQSGINELDMSGLSTGEYILRIVYGNNTSVHKIIVR